MRWMVWGNYKICVMIGVVLSFIVMVGCSGLQPHIQFDVSLPSMYQWEDIKKIAVLDFAVPLGDSQAGSYVSSQLAMVLSEKSNYQVQSIYQSRSVLKSLRLLPSRFRETGIIKLVGDKLDVNALLFGDVPVFKLLKKTEKQTVQRQIGEEIEEYIWIDSKGLTRTSQRLIPIYKDVLQREIHRTVMIEIEARLVSINENEVLWQNKVSFEKYHYAFEEGNERKGNWSSDEALLTQGLRQGGIKLIGPLLPKKVKKTRFFAVPFDKSEYAELVKQGTKVAQKKRWNEAGQFWLQAIQMDANRLEARANLGIMRELAGEHEQAMKDYKSASLVLGGRWKSYYEDIQSYLNYIIRTLHQPKSSK